MTVTTPTLIEIGHMFLHLPTCAAGIHGFVRGEDGGPDVGGTMRRMLPVGEGGTIRLFEGLDPMRHSTTTGPVVDVRHERPGFDRHGFDWAQRSTSDVQAAAQKLGWRPVTRRKTAALLTQIGYQLHPRRDADGRPHFHNVLWTDHIDDLTWHVRESFDGKPFTHTRCTFVVREVPL